MEEFFYLMAAMLCMTLTIKFMAGSFDRKSNAAKVGEINIDGVKAEDNRYTKWAAEENAKAAADNRKAAEANLKAEELRLERIKLQQGE